MIEFVRAENFTGIPFFQYFENHLLHIIQVLFGLKRVIHAVVALFVKFRVGNIRVVAEVRAAGGFHEPMCHERAG